MAEQPGDGGRTGVLLIQLGTPEAPRAAEVRRYLREFLSDPRVVELPRLVWWPILNGIVLTVRPRRSAAKYAKIWTADGSPLKVHTRRQASLLRGYLGEAGARVEVAYAMRYGEPSVARVLRELRQRGLNRLLVVPLYPQYAGSTTGAAFDALFREFSGWRRVPDLRTIAEFHDDAGFIDAWADRIESLWRAQGRADVLLMSFHGVPRRTIEQGDPYAEQCRETARKLALALGLKEGRYRITYQSRFGAAKWLEPFTDQTLVELAREGVASVDVCCPGFVSDCLETLEEIAIEARESFLSAGGKQFRYIECPNEDPGFMRVLANLTRRHLAGWVDPET